jgi:hypothetical protein
MSYNVWIAGMLALAVALGSGAAAAQAGQAIKIGGMCDRTGATQVLGSETCRVLPITSRWSTGKAGSWGTS